MGETGRCNVKHNDGWIEGVFRAEGIGLKKAVQEERVIASDGAVNSLNGVTAVENDIPVVQPEFRRGLEG